MPYHSVELLPSDRRYLVYEPIQVASALIFQHNGESEGEKFQPMRFRICESIEMCVMCYFVQVLARFPAMNSCRVGEYTLESINQRFCTAEATSSSIFGPTDGRASVDRRTEGSVLETNVPSPVISRSILAKIPEISWSNTAAFLTLLAGGG